MRNLLYDGTKISIFYDEVHDIETNTMHFVATIESFIIQSRTARVGIFETETQIHINQSIRNNDLISLVSFFEGVVDIWSYTEDNTQIILTRLNNTTISISVHGLIENMSYSVQWKEITEVEK